MDTEKESYRKLALWGLLVTALGVVGLILIHPRPVMGALVPPVAIGAVFCAVMAREGLNR